MFVIFELEQRTILVLSMVKENKKHTQRTEIKKHFDEIDHQYILSVGLEYQSPLLKAVISQYTKDPSIKRVLDVGSGTGTFTNLTKETVPNLCYVILDISKNVLHYSGIENKVQGDAVKLPFATNTIDL